MTIATDCDAIAERLRWIGFGPADAENIRSIAPVVIANLDALTDSFFKHLEAMGEGNRAALAQARPLKRAHLEASVQGRYDSGYAEQRLALGRTYAAAGVRTTPFLGAFHELMRQIGRLVMEKSHAAPLDGYERFMSYKRIAFFDLGLIVDSLTAEAERVIRTQSEAIRELSTPVLAVEQGLLILPIIGAIDTLRARQMTQRLLESVRAHRARVAVMDITGVPVVDSLVGNHLIQTAQAARLMGAEVIITGMSAEVAQALVTLGLELEGLRTFVDLRGGIEAARALTRPRAEAARTETRSTSRTPDAPLPEPRRKPA